MNANCEKTNPLNPWKQRTFSDSRHQFVSKIDTLIGRETAKTNPLLGIVEKGPERFAKDLKWHPLELVSAKTKPLPRCAG